MQSIEGNFWRDRAMAAFRAAWTGESHEGLAYLFSLGEPGDRPHTRSNVPDHVSDEEFLAAQQRVFTENFSAQMEPFGIGQDMPSQWADPLPIMDIATIAENAGGHRERGT